MPPPPPPYRLSVVERKRGAGRLEARNTLLLFKAVRLLCSNHTRARRMENFVVSNTVLLSWRCPFVSNSALLSALRLSRAPSLSRCHAVCDGRGLPLWPPASPRSRVLRRPPRVRQARNVSTHAINILDRERYFLLVYALL